MFPNKKVKQNYNITISPNMRQKEIDFIFQLKTSSYFYFDYTTPLLHHLYFALTILLPKLNSFTKKIQQLLIFSMDLIEHILVKYYQLNIFIYTQLIKVYPRFDNYNHFEKFLLLNLAVISTFILISFICSISPKAIYRGIVRWVFTFGFVRRGVAQQLRKVREKILGNIPVESKPKLSSIGYKPPQFTISDDSQRQSLKGKLSGSRYCVKSHCNFIISLAKKFSFSNPLHIQTFPFVKQMENEVIEMTGQAIGLKDQNDQVCGLINSGGTQSIMMAIFAYREYMFKRGVSKPNLVVCKTGHVAAFKACDYLGIEVREASYDKNYQMSISSMKSLMDENTICVYTSYPNYPYGICDPIDDIAQICRRKNVPVHIDMCLGGFLCPFLEGWKLPPRGVTSISADPHKYGLSAKGVSVLLYSSQKYRKSQYFTTCFWPGGLYGTPGMAGSRTGVFIASAWISIMKLGQRGFKQNAKLVSDATIKLKESLTEMGFKIYGNPQICVVGFTHPQYSVNSIQTAMKKRGWGISLMQKPLCLHFSFTPLNALNIKEMIKDFKESLDEVRVIPPIKDSAEIELYGACAKIPDGETKNQILATVIDTFIDLS